MSRIAAIVVVLFAVSACDSGSSDSDVEEYTGAYTIEDLSWRWVIGNESFNEILTGEIDLVQDGGRISGVGTCRIETFSTIGNATDFMRNYEQEFVLQGLLSGGIVTADISREEPKLDFFPLVGCPEGRYVGPAASGRITLTGEHAFGALRNGATLETANGDSTKFEVLVLASD